MLERLFASEWRRQDICLAMALLALGSFVIVQANRLPPPFFDPLGSAAVPRMVSALLMVLALVLVIRCLRTPVGAHADADSRGAGPGVEDAAGTPSPWTALAAATLPLLYVGVMQFRILGFAPASTLFVLVMGGVLARGRPRVMLAVALAAIVTGYGLNALLTGFFYIDLPQHSFWEEGH
ncbi:MAG: tripartite tricarboxylate transporter TctB family protein [Geminicoccaceae bacterium]|nr:tripartite tricarboxylate transporter TctB family protein [Geminicoccaceae bacterium]